MRRPYVVGNWKMNHTLVPARSVVRALRERLPAQGGPVDVGIAPSYVLLMPMCKEVDGTSIRLGGQNMYHAHDGAFTGEVAPDMLLDAGCSFVIIGHSERRQVFNEPAAMLSRKVAMAIETGLDVIYCIGETLEQREAGQTTDVLLEQLADVLPADLAWERLTIAYEPVWAIGTGRTATSDQAQEAHAVIRQWLGQHFGAAAAEAIRIQYGGSVKPGNAAELLAQPDVDGALVGGASLVAEDFAAIIEAAPVTC